MNTEFTLKRVITDNVLFTIVFGCLAIWGGIERWDLFLSFYFGILTLTWVVYFLANKNK